MYRAIRPMMSSLRAVRPGGAGGSSSLFDEDSMKKRMLGEVSKLEVGGGGEEARVARVR